MKNRFVLLIVFAAMLMSLTLPASSVQAAGKTATLVDFVHEPAKGWTAIFVISGDWKEADLKGNTITVDGKTYKLYCNFKDDTHISCTMHHDMGQLIGKPAILFFGGQTFTHGVPPKRICNSWNAKWMWGLENGYNEFGTYVGTEDEKYYAALIADGGDEYWYWYYEWRQSWGTVSYGNNTPLDEPFYYYNEESGTYQTEGYDTEWTWWMYNYLQYYDVTCSAAEYTSDYASYEWIGQGSGYTEEECIGDSCEYESEYDYCEEGDNYYGYCDETGCYDFIEEDSPYCTEGAG